MPKYYVAGFDKKSYVLSIKTTNHTEIETSPTTIGAIIASMKCFSIILNNWQKVKTANGKDQAKDIKLSLKALMKLFKKEIK